MTSTNTTMTSALNEQAAVTTDPHTGITVLSSIIGKYFICKSKAKF